MRNIFDQYNQPENRLTHALASVLNEDDKLLKSFFKDLVKIDSPPVSSLHIIEQTLPGLSQPVDEKESSGLPDATIHDDEGWAVIIESKITSALTSDQLNRHRKTIQKRGFTNLVGVTITVDPDNTLSETWKNITWQEIYHWASQNTSYWSTTLVEYFNIAENRMVKENYLQEGTLTDFTGIPFGEKEPINYLEGKRVLKLLMNKIRKNDKAKSLGLDVDRGGRGGITKNDVLWDFIPLKSSDGAKSFTEHIHLDVMLKQNELAAYLIVPNNAKGISKNIKSLTFIDFQKTIEQVVWGFEKICEFDDGCTPIIEIEQRHYLNQRSAKTVDGVMKFDIRTAVKNSSNIKLQQEWLKASLEILQNKKSNIQLGLGITFQYDRCKELKKSTADELILKAWETAMPMKDLFLNKE